MNEACSVKLVNLKHGGIKMLRRLIFNSIAFILLASAFILTPAVKSWSEEPAAPAAEESTPKTVFGNFIKDMGLEITGSGTMDFYDKYVWRGQYLDRDAVVQPGFSFSAKGFTVGYWGSFPLEKGDALDSSESDYYVSYAYTINPVTLSVGHTWYQFPGGSTSSKEVYVSAALATFLSPSITFFHDYEDGADLNTDGSGNYWLLSIAQSVPLIKEYNISLELGMQFGYVDGQWLSGQGEHLTPTAGIKVPLTANLTVTPTIGYNIPFGDLEDENIGNQEAKFFGGVKTAYAF